VPCDTLARGTECFREAKRKVKDSFTASHQQSTSRLPFIEAAILTSGTPTTMPIKLIPPSRAVVAIACIVMAGGAWAQDGRGEVERGRVGHAEQGHPRPPRENPAPAPQRSTPEPRRSNDNGLAESVRRVERSTRGEVLSAERMQSDGHEINRIKVIDDRGRVRVYMDDPQQSQSQKRKSRDEDN